MNKERAISVGLEIRDDISAEMEELNALIYAAGAEVVETTIQKKDRIESRTYIGKGKVEEIAEKVENEKIDMVVFNHELSGSQIRNLEEMLKCKVVDRTNLILDIFALRADTLEGKLQVKLAQLQYRMPRIIGFSDYLSRTGGGIGTRGPGEQKLETDRRHIQREIHQIKQDLKDIEKQRAVTRERRNESPLPIVALVGYTNAGKSSLMNALIDSDDKVYVEDMLFASLDTSMRQAYLPSGQKYLLADTVGFVSNLPTLLVEAFKSTLEELEDADILLHVVDVSHDELDLQIETTFKLLDEMEVLDRPILTIYNKMDLLEEEPYLNHASVHESITMSAHNNEDIKKLQNKIEEMLSSEVVTYYLDIPFEDYGLYHKLHEYGSISETHHHEKGVYVKANVSKKVSYLYEKYVISNETFQKNISNV